MNGLVRHNFPEGGLLEIVDLTLSKAKNLGAEFAEVGISTETGFSVNARQGDVETLEQHQSKGLVITVYQHQRMGSASTSDLSIPAIISAVEKAASIATFSGQDPFSGLAEPELMAYHYPNLDLYHPWKISPADAIQMAIECEGIARAQDPRITASDGASVSTFDYYRIYGNSHGFVGHYPLSEHSIHCSVIAKDNDGQMQRDYDYTVARNPNNLDDITFLAKKTAQQTLMRLGAKKIKTQSCPVIFHAPAAKGLLSSFVGAISGRNIYRGSSFLVNSIGKNIFPSTIDIFQQPHLIAGMGSSPFDSEGVKTEDRYFVEQGVLQNYVLGSYSARKLGLKSTGNAGGIYNLSINHSDLKLAELFKKMHTGLLVTELMGQGVNILTGDYSRGAAGFWIENGEIQHAVEEITIAGKLPEMFMNIEMVANDVDTRGTIRTGSILLKNMMVGGS